MRYKTLLLIPALMAISFGVGRWQSGGGQAMAAHSRILYYSDPMHPSYRSDRPGTAPDCGMALEPVYEGTALATPVQPIANAVRISAEKQQLIGVRLGTVTRGGGERVLRTTGRVVADESRMYRLTARMDGWIRQLYADSTGSYVKKGQPLLSVYSRELQTAQQGYLFSLNQVDRLNNGDAPDALERLKLAVSDAQTNLLGMGMSAPQIEQIARERKILPAVDLVAPAAGIIISRNVYAEQRFDKGADFYRIVDLTHVWILADLFGREAEGIAPGAIARVTSLQHSGNLTAKAASVLPQFDAASRTLKLRLDADNPNLSLKPDMFVDVEFTVRAHAGLMVPAEAVLDSGSSKSVFVDRGEGYFEPRTVITGAAYGDSIEIVSGLREGERIAVSGTFLIDSEARLRKVSQESEKPPADPVCGMPLADPATAKHAEHAGKSYAFCSDGCRRQFEADPARFAAKSAAFHAKSAGFTAKEDK